MIKTVYRFSCSCEYCITGISLTGVKIYTGPYSGHDATCPWWKDLEESGHALTEDLYRDTNRHPSPWKDVHDFSGSAGKVFGFTSINSLKGWFYKEFRECSENMTIHSYKVPSERIEHGRRQVAFPFKCVQEEVFTLPKSLVV